ncbi:hypothetical protein [Nocardioides sp. 1609]|uniref:hypothetical protein n=1 Tax=Nocardioides sp. 1609 TaxID=2508327 RepID=UPI00106FB46B|nr:hypothetical protein [Nocardioides sp. 1609]
MTRAPVRHLSTADDEGISVPELPTPTPEDTVSAGPRTVGRGGRVPVGAAARASLPAHPLEQTAREHRCGVR